jgi:hypothetical protein
VNKEDDMLNHALRWVDPGIGAAGTIVLLGAGAGTANAVCRLDAT